MSDAATATAHVPKDAPAPARPAVAPEAVVPEVALETDVQRLVGSLHQAGSAAGAGAPPTPGPGTWTARTSRTPRDLAALQRLAGNRAVAGLVRRNVQRQQTGTLPKPAGTTTPGATPTPGTAPKAAEPFELQYQALTLDQAVKDLLKDITIPTDVIVVGLQRNLIAIYDKKGTRLVQVELKLPESVRPMPGVYVTPPASEAIKQNTAFALRRLMVDPATKDWVLGGYTAFLKQEEKAGGKAGTGDPGAVGAPGVAGLAAAPGAPGAAGKADTALAPGASDGEKDAVGKPKPPPFIDVEAFVADRARLDAVIAQHADAWQFFLVPQVAAGAGATGKPGGARTTGFAGELEGKGTPPNAPPWPVAIQGPKMLNIGGVAPFAAKINWAANDSSMIGMVSAQIGTQIHYRWELFDVSAAADRHKAKSLAQAKETEAKVKAALDQGLVPEFDPRARAGVKAPAKPGAPGGGGPGGGQAAAVGQAGAGAGAGAGGGGPTGTDAGAGKAEPSFDDEMAAKAREKAGAGAEVDDMAGADLEFNRKFSHLSKDTRQAWKDLGSKRSSSYLERHSQNVANLAALELLPASALITTVGASLMWLTEWLGSDGDQREIPIPKKGHYLVRVIATPRVQTDHEGNDIIRPSTVASQVVEVVEFGRMVQEGLDDPADRVQQLRTEAERVKNNEGEASDRYKELKTKLDMLELETAGDPKVLLEKKIAIKEEELKAVEATYEGKIRGPIIEVENELSTLRKQLEIFELQKRGRSVLGDPVTSTPTRLNAMLASEVTGQAYPLILSAATIASSGNEFGWKILDVTSKKGEGFVGRGSSSSAALYRALENFGREAAYGRGTIGVRLPQAVMDLLEQGSRTELQVESAPAGWAIARARIDDLVMVLVALGLLVSSAGTAAALIGAAVAAARLIDRLYNGTLELDEEAINDGLAVLGGIGIGAQKAVGMSVKYFGNKAFALLPEGAASEAKIAEATLAMQRVAGIAKQVEVANEVLNYAGVLWGNLTFAGQMASISSAELNDKITHAEARRQRAAALGGAIQNNGLFLAGNYLQARAVAKSAKSGRTGAASETRAPTGKAEPTPRDIAVPKEAGLPKEQTVPTEPRPSNEPAPREGTQAADDASGAKRLPGAGETGPSKAGVATDGPGSAGQSTAREQPPTAPGALTAPKPGSARERQAAHRNLVEAANGQGDVRAAAEDAIGKGGSWKEDLKGALKGLEGDARVAAEKALVEAREGMVEQEWLKVKTSDPRFADLTLDNSGTRSFGSDIDATVRPGTEANAAGREMGDQVKLAAEAAQKLSDALRERVGGETDNKIDTNIYSFIGEGRLKPVDPRSRAAQQHVDVVVGLAEQLRGQRDSQVEAIERRLVGKAGDPRVAAEVRRVVGEAREFRGGRELEWQKALRDAGVPANGKPTPTQERIAREAILGAKKGELSSLLAGQPPNYEAIARKQSEINWFAPDAYATPSAFKQAVAHGQRLKGTARDAATMKAVDIAASLREKAAKLPEQDPRARRLESDARLVESQQRLLEMSLAELKTAQEQMLAEQEHGPAAAGERVRELEARAAGIREAIARSAERLLVADILEITAPADQPGPERLTQSAAAAGANMGMLEGHVRHAKDVDGQVKAAAKYAARIAMAEMLAGLKTSADPIARLISEFVQSRWSIFEAESPQIMRDMFLRYAELKGRHQDIVRNAAGEPVGVTDRLKADFVADASQWARDANDRLQLAAIGSKAMTEPALAETAAGAVAGTSGGTSAGGDGPATPPGAPGPGPSETLAVPAETPGGPAPASTGETDQGAPGGPAGPGGPGGPGRGGGGGPEPGGGGPPDRRSEAAIAAEGESAAEIARLRQRLYQWRGETADLGANQMVDAHLAELRELAADLRRGESVEGRLAGIREALPEHRRLLRPADIAAVDTLLNRIERDRARSRDQDAIRELDRLRQELMRLRDRLQNVPGADVRAQFDSLRRQAGRAGRQDYEVFVDLTDPVVKGELFAWFSDALRPLAEGTVGQILEDMILSHIASADALVLQQSPRSAGTPVRDTAAMRPFVLEAVRAGRYPPEYVAAFEAAARGQADGWPRTPDGRVWEVDHVGELWLGGADDVTNYLALPPGLHDAKSVILTRFRREYREGNRVPGEQMDLRERD